MLTEPKRLLPNDIKYLAFEGGGGKGAAYLGAIWALQDEEIGVLRWIRNSTSKLYQLDSSRINGVSGSSAGAITAALLVSGYTIRDINRFLLSGFDRYFNDAIPRKRPLILKSNSRCIEKCEIPEKSSYNALYKVIKSVYSLGIVKPLVGSLFLLLQKYEAIQKIIADLPAYVWNLFEDFGFFSGCTIATDIDKMIAQQTRLPNGDPWYGVTFKDHFLYHNRINLVLTGTNLTTGTSHYFSVDTSPDFRVADAVRISMSIPFLFKPVIIPSNEKYGGVWVDGGLMNNLPIHAFDDPGSTQLNRNIIGLRLDYDQPNLIEDLSSFTLAVFGTLLGMSEKSQIRSNAENLQTVRIDAGKLETAVFEANPKDMQNAIDMAAIAVMNYFGIDRKPKPID